MLSQVSMQEFAGTFGEHLRCARRSLSVAEHRELADLMKRCLERSSGGVTKSNVQEVSFSCVWSAC
eukprot:6266335-Prorocentrum_lima.AAC.1